MNVSRVYISRSFSVFRSEACSPCVFRFQAIDTQRDGAIDFDEFLAFVAKLKRGDGEQRRRSASLQVQHVSWGVHAFQGVFGCGEVLTFRNAIKRLHS